MIRLAVTGRTGQLACALLERSAQAQSQFGSNQRAEFPSPLWGGASSYERREAAGGGGRSGGTTRPPPLTPPHKGEGKKADHPVSPDQALTPDIEVIALGRPDLDLERPATVAAAIRAARPDVVVNAAAFTAVDRAEAEPDRAFAVNRDGAAAVARAAAALNIPLIHLSTDYVFAGAGQGACVETDATGPLNVYGASKLAGEIAVRQAHDRALILRTSWLYSPFGGNFVKTMLRLGRQRRALEVVDDQFGNPTSALDLADAILRLAPRLAAGSTPGATFHLAGAGVTTWCGFARYIFEMSHALGGPRALVVGIASADYPAAARRPPNSSLDCGAFATAFGFSLDPWREGVERVVHRLLAEAK